MKSRQQIQDETIVGTNSYSIVSKRSVEKLYHTDEPSFLRPFVSKFKRRAPLINRGYWLRIKAIEQVVQHFLDGLEELGPKASRKLQQPKDSEHSRRKVVVNLGCGEDTLPFRALWMRRKGERAGQCECEENMTFVDIDYPELISRKVDAILCAPTLKDAIRLDHLNRPFNGSNSEPGIFLNDSRYIAIGADLSDLDTLSKILRDSLDLNEKDSAEKGLDVLFVAEVSITYMPATASDAVIRWARNVLSKVPFATAHFCLLEQILPSGPHHPFAKTMMNHFQKSAPLKSVELYSTLEGQFDRFKRAGWEHVEVQTLWDLFQDPCFLNREQRLSLNRVEAFDEWEEFALFASHYVLLLASSESRSRRFDDLSSKGAELKANPSEAAITLYCTEYPSHPRRFAASSSSNAEIMTVAGFDSITLTKDCLQYVGPTNGETQQQRAPQLSGPLACHSLTKISNGSYLISGGRTSPTKASSSCWLLPAPGSGSQDPQPRAPRIWRQVAALEPGRFRHCAACIGLGDWEGVLVFGGKASNGDVLDDWQFLSLSKDLWSSAIVAERKPGARFGASLAVTNAKSDSATGWLFGGLDDSGFLLQDLWQWTAYLDENGVTMRFLDCSQHVLGYTDLIPRFGAVCIPSPLPLVASNGHVLSEEHAEILVIGGVGRKGVFEHDGEIVLISKDLSVRKVTVADWELQRRLLVGHSVAVVEDEIALLGGGAVCFSFGSFWNNNMLILGSTKKVPTVRSEWTLLKSAEHSRPGDNARPQQLDPQPGYNLGAKPLTTLPAHVHSVSQSTNGIAATFRKLVASPSPSPHLFPSQDLGPCTERWKPSYLIAGITADKSVTIHRSSIAFLDFSTKNFNYETVSAREFIDSARRGEHVYLRSLAASQPARVPADISQDFPSLSLDFHVPRELADVLTVQDGEHSASRIHSSVLRIAGNVTMWLHYDTQSNILCQIRGRKRVVLFPPSDVARLGFPPGSTTSSADVFGARGILSRWHELDLHPKDVTLSKGDILYIPACWPHATAPGGPSGDDTGEDGAMNVAVNVFFRAMLDGYAPGRDVYGNRDLEAYQNGRRDVHKIREALRRPELGVESSGIDDTVAMLARVVRGEASEQHVGSPGLKEARAIRKKLNALPEQLRGFYAQRLAGEIEGIPAGEI